MRLALVDVNGRLKVNFAFSNQDTETPAKKTSDIDIRMPTPRLVSSR